MIGHYGNQSWFSNQKYLDLHDCVPSISDPEERPDFSTLVDDFESKLVQETDYIDLNMFPEHAYYNDVSLSGEKVWPVLAPKLKPKRNKEIRSNQK